MGRHVVFVAGATGYLGRRVVPELLERGSPVSGIRVVEVPEIRGARRGITARA